MSNNDPYIIFLRGVQIDDYKNIEDEFNERLLEGIGTNDPYKNDQVKYDNIPCIFINNDTWMKNNNICCWTCDFTFSTVPIFIPISIKGSTDNNWNISVYGNFCSFPCAARHIIDYMSEDLLDSLIKLYEIFYNKRIQRIYPSPRRYIMLKYGGYMTDENYVNTIRKLSYTLDRESNIKREYSSQSIMEEIDNESEDDNIWDILKTSL